MPKVDTNVEELVGRIERGELRLPELQRGYVWPATRVRDLLDSLYRGYPSGMILSWESEEEQVERDLAIEQVQRPPIGNQLLLLDGQQRLTSLATILSGKPLKIRNRVRPIDIAFNLEHPEGAPLDVADIEDDGLQPLEELDGEDEPNDDALGPGPGGDGGIQESLRRSTFVVASRALFADPRWVKVSEIFDQSKSDWNLLKPRGVTPDDPRWERYTTRLQRVRAIRKYPYVMQVLERDKTYEEVAEIFVRVNSLGMKLKSSDLALAQITARWPGFLDQLEQFQEECEDHWFNLDIGVFVRAMVVAATKQSRFKTVGRVPITALQSAWPKAQDGLRFAINFLRQNGGVEDESLLSSPYFLIVIADYALQHNRHLTESEQRQLLHWLLVGNAMARYSGSSESRLDADLAVVHRGDPPSALLDAVVQQVGRTRFNARDFEHRSVRSPLFATAYLALRNAGAKDWGSGLRISLTHQGKWHWIEYHHIFPKSVLARAGVLRADINEIANLAFLSSGKNKMLGIKTPDQYFPTVVDSHGEEALRRHAIPLDRELWKVENYPAFLVERRRLLADAVNTYLDEMAAEGRPAIDPIALIADGEGDSIEFKETGRFNVNTNAVDRAMEGAVVKSVAAFLNTRGGTLFIGVDDHGQAVGLEKDLTTLTGRANTDGYEQWIRQLLVTAMGAGVVASIGVGFPEIDSREVCMVRVPPAQGAVYVPDGNGTALFVRAGNTSRRLDTAEVAPYVKSRFGA